MPRKSPSPPKIVSITLSAAALLVLCLLGYATWRSASAPSAAELARSAEEAVVARDFRAAVIHYKAAVQAAPEDLALRRALGQLHLQLRQFADALNHLRLARPLGNAQPEVVLDLARAQVELGKFEDAGRTLADYRGEDAGTAASLRARVQHALGQTEEAKALLEAQRAKTPRSVEIHLARARMALAERDLPGAVDALRRALEEDPEHAEAQTLMGLARLQQGDSGLAAAHLKAAVAHAANPLEALTGLAEAQLMRREHQPARETIALIAERAPKAPALAYLRGWLAWSKGNWTNAESELQKALKVIKTNPRLLLMLADSTLRQDKLNQAEAYLKTLETLAPGLAVGRQLLGRVQLKQKRALEAIDTLTPLAAAKPADVSTLVMLSQAHRLVGHKDRSQAYLQQAASLTPDSLQTSLLEAVSDLEAGQLAQGIAGLQALREGELAVPSTRALVMAQTAQGEPELALESARALVKLAPEDAASHQLLGSLLLRTGDEAAARKAFARALELTPDHAPTQTSLGLLALAKNDPAAAEALLRKALAQDARFEPAAVALGLLFARNGRGAEADAVLDAAIVAQPQAGAPRWLRAERYLQQGDREKGLALARKAFELAPAVPANQLRWGIFLLSAGSSVQAVEVLKALVDDDPDAFLARAALARAAQATGQWPLARAQFEALLAQVPDHGPSLWALLGLELAAKDHAAAEAVAVRIAQAQPGTSAGALARAEILAARGAHAKALENFREVHKADGSARSLLRLVDAAIAASDETQARELLREWLQAHPGDLAPRLRLAEFSLMSGDQAAAISSYETLLEQSPLHPIALNNLAWLYDQKRDPRARATAEKALQAMPQSPEAMDTLGWILVREDAADEGLPWLEKAHTRAPAAADIAFHHAYALAETGKTLQAERLVTSLLEAHDNFNSLADAKALMRRLQSHDEMPESLR